MNVTFAPELRLENTRTGNVTNFEENSCRLNISMLPFLSIMYHRNNYLIARGKNYAVPLKLITETESISTVIYK